MLEGLDAEHRSGRSVGQADRRDVLDPIDARARPHVAADVVLAREQLPEVGVTFLPLDLVGAELDRRGRDSRNVSATRRQNALLWSRIGVGSSMSRVPGISNRTILIGRAPRPSTDLRAKPLAGQAEGRMRRTPREVFNPAQPRSPAGSAPACTGAAAAGRRALPRRSRGSVA